MPTSEVYTHGIDSLCKFLFESSAIALLKLEGLKVWQLDDLGPLGRSRGATVATETRKL